MLIMIKGKPHIRVRLRDSAVLEKAEGLVVILLVVQKYVLIVTIC